MSTIKSFIKEAVARIGGDTAQVTAQKNYRKATSAIKSQVAALQAKEVDEEAAVEQAQENLSNAKFPTTLLTDNKSYVSGIQYAQDALVRAQDALEATRASIKYFSGLLVSFDEEV
jgi:isopropylmalate/homocitrate/citramalate synthase